MVRIEVITPDLARKHRNEITEFYFENVRSNQYREHFGWEEAEEKIGGFISHLENNECIAFRAFEDEQMIGFIWAYEHKFREENRMYISEIRVKESYRRRGLGRTFLQLVEEKAKELGISALYLHAEANNPAANCFYQSLGYAEERIQYRKEIR